MKLYTEEQVRHAFDKGYKYAQSIRPASMEYHYQYVEGEINSLTPIQLPSDEEILALIGDGMHDYYKGGFEEGAKWMRNKILNK